MNLFGVDWAGINAENGHKLLLSLIFIAVILGLSMAILALIGMARSEADMRFGPDRDILRQVFADRQKREAQA